MVFFTYVTKFSFYVQYVISISVIKPYDRAEMKNLTLRTP